jgi:hypothetical protein
MKRKGMKFIGLLTLLLITFVFSISSAEIPGSVSFEGFLTEAGLPIDETVEMRFALYDSETAVSPLWSQHQIIKVKQGVYSVVFTSFPKKVFLRAQYYLGVEVGREKESVCLGRHLLTTAKSEKIMFNYSL